MESPRAAIELGSGGLAASAGAGATSKARARARVVATTETARRMALPHRSGGEAARISKREFHGEIPVVNPARASRSFSVATGPGPGGNMPQPRPRVGWAQTAGPRSKAVDSTTDARER